MGADVGSDARAIVLAVLKDMEQTVPVPTSVGPDLRVSAQAPTSVGPTGHYGRASA